MSQLIRIENKRSSLVFLPAIASKREGDKVIRPEYMPFELKPGGNNVPADYVQALRDSHHADYFESLQRDHGEGEILVVHSPKESAKLTKQPEGPRPPASLVQYSDIDVCKALIASETDVDALTRWAKNDKRPDVQAACQLRLEALKVS